MILKNDIPMLDYLKTKQLNNKQCILNIFNIVFGNQYSFGLLTTELFLFEVRNIHIKLNISGSKHSMRIVFFPP